MYEIYVRYIYPDINIFILSIVVSFRDQTHFCMHCWDNLIREIKEDIVSVLAKKNADDEVCVDPNKRSYPRVIR